METQTLQEQIDKFYKETGYLLNIKDGKPYYGSSIFIIGASVTGLPDNLVVGALYLNYSNIITKLPNNLVVGRCLDLIGANITELPENLVVGSSLYLNNTRIAKLPDNLVVGGSLDIRDTEITELPDNLVVGGNLYLERSKVTELPNNLVVGGWLDLKGTKIKKLPDNLTVGGDLDLYDTNINKLPDNLVVGGNLDLGYTDVTKLPENLVVGHCLYIRNSKVNKLPDSLVVGGSIFGMSRTEIIPTLTKEVKGKLLNINKFIQRSSFLQWEQGNKTYIKVDNIFSVVDNHKGNVWVTHQIGKEETLYIVTDGEGHYAHGDSLKEAKGDLVYKINDRDTSSYENLSLDDEVSFEEAIVMYRTITGACAAGTRSFVENRLPEPHKEKYTIREVIELTDGEYGSEKLKKFF